MGIDGYSVFKIDVVYRRYSTISKLHTIQFMLIYAALL